MRLFRQIPAPPPPPARPRTSVGTLNEATREAWIRQKLSAIPAGSNILDAGAGTQCHKAYCAHLAYTSQDFAQYDGSGDSKGLQMGEFPYGKLDIVSDITAIPVANGSFDAIMCTEVLEHLPDPGAAIREFGRIVRPGGSLLLTAPFCSLTHFAPYHFASGLNRYWYEHHLQKNSFAIEEITSNGNFFEFVAQELRRLPHIASRYEAGGVSAEEAGHLDALLETLERLSSQDQGSSELLCFGLQVMARKT